MSLPLYRCEDAGAEDPGYLVAVKKKPNSGHVLPTPVLYLLDLASTVRGLGAWDLADHT